MKGDEDQTELGDRIQGGVRKKRQGRGLIRSWKTEPDNPPRQDLTRAASKNEGRPRKGAGLTRNQIEKQRNGVRTGERGGEETGRTEELGEAAGGEGVQRHRHGRHLRSSSARAHSMMRPATNLWRRPMAMRFSKRFDEGF
ncbi:hypothetical protein MUK42_04577 [Musa troglodytarum]|uniref:Uncharacterized protein n=1 Tax=Musa troglodytarum TaxID=320322 RepID=A0A9E7GBF4_9LILI|nr:hypothetical protein MUK42_04577 [Musa troglodytarum]